MLVDIGRMVSAGSGKNWGLVWALISLMVKGEGLAAWKGLPEIGMLLLVQ